MVKSVFGHGGQRYVHLDYLEGREAIPELEAGELYDKMTHRPYRTDPLDSHHGMTDARVKSIRRALSPV